MILISILWKDHWIVSKLLSKLKMEEKQLTIFHKKIVNFIKNMRRYYNL